MSAPATICKYDILSHYFMRLFCLSGYTVGQGLLLLLYYTVHNGPAGPKDICDKYWIVELPHLPVIIDHK